MTAPTIADIRAAQERMRGVARVTPLLEAELLNRVAGRRVLVKAECLQITGSFKFRGAWNALSMLTDAERERGVLAYSSGNHAQGVAEAARLKGAKASIIMPSDAPAAKIAATRAYGAEVILYDRAKESRETLGGDLAAERGLTLIKPYDDPRVIAGQGVTGLEIAEQAQAAGVEDADVFVCCGGGGLASGIALALESDAPGLRAHPCEPEGFDDWRHSLETGRRAFNNAAVGSLQDAILTPAPGEITWPIGRRLFGPGFAVSDEQALAAMAAAWRYLKIVLEPGGACALAAALFHKPEVARQAVIVTASGGNVDPAVFVRALNEA